ncbi:MAG: glycosyltransferase family 4 protein [Deltaproteobacteria bacterium]|nr:glycosyltransferase family 4 protein [Deltaproteobacteria bacterium]
MDKDFEMMKVAVIEPVGGHGGMNYYDFSLCRGLSQAGADVTLYTCDETHVPEGLSYSVKLFFKKIYGADSKYKRALRYITGLNSSFRDARRHGVTVMHFHIFHPFFMEWLSLKMAKAYGFKIVITVHDVESFSGKKMFKLSNDLYKSADRLIVHNKACRDSLLKSYPDLSSDVEIIPLGNLVEYANRSVTKKEAKEKLGLKGEGPFLLFWGQIKEAKGLDILVDALPAVVKKIPSLRLLIAGKVWRNDFSKYQAMIDKYGIAENVISRIEYIPDELVDYYYNASDLIVLPYRLIYQSSVLLMAMSYGKAVIASDLPGMLEIIKDNSNGFVFRTNDHEHLSKRLIEILSNPAHLEKIAKSGFDTAVTRFDWNDIGVSTLNAYKKL